MKISNAGRDAGTGKRVTGVTDLPVIFLYVTLSGIHGLYAFSV
jgi:hypothetical protein